MSVEKIYKGADGVQNAAKAARKSLGSDAKRGLDFDVIKVEGGAVWRSRDLAKTGAAVVASGEPSQDDATGQPAESLGTPVATEVEVDVEARKEVPAPTAKAGESGPGLLARLFPLGKSNGKGKPTLPSTEDAIAKATAFTTFLMVGGKRLRKEHPTLAAASAHAFLLRQEHPGRDVLVYAVGDFPGGDVVIAAKYQIAASAAHINQTAAQAPAAKAKVAKKAAKAEKKTEAKKDRPLGARAQVEADALAGKLPKVPDFSAETHKRFRPKLEEVVKLVKARDIKGLKAFYIKPISTSPKAIAKYQRLSLVALEAQRKAKG